ncbi:T-cell immunomodulatory protein homolog [Babesia microti strain RI]|uniref:T-cell immunomodulatory protein homolog n=1 Tax=Babesia microti (strain RI) TaxID=1133968 RepID=A0A1N6LX64_BABMR|nr:T-cell immunomodulatory protein homolog [Babesia microti strain RI]SIO73468.1 T-cell immunomodulatory protein homolog [Babesia microti strain RI]|eukprot:XP_021337564.1 T-cell immunomodulatory protein homolog [Babesia microti strain RI]
MGVGIYIWVLLISLFHDVLGEFESGGLKLDLIGEVADYGDFYGKNEINIFTFLYYKSNDLYKNTVIVYSLDKKKNKYEISYMFEFEHQGFCEGMIVTDWTMDSRVDALLYLRDEKGIYIVGLAQSAPIDEVEFSIAWTSRDLIGPYLQHENGNIQLAPEESRHNSNIHPLLCDINGDGRVDMITQGHDGTRVVWINDGKVFIPYAWDDVPNVRFVKYDLGMLQDEDQNENVGGNTDNVQLLNITVPHSNGFVDINGDCRPDLLFTVGTDNVHMIEIWLSDVEVGENVVVTNYRQIEKLQLPVHPGQLIFADFNGDGSIDIGIPSCIPDEGSKNCISSSFNIMFNHQQPLCNNLWKDSTVKCRKPTELCTKTPFEISKYQVVKFDNSEVSGANDFVYMNNSNFGNILRLAYGDFDLDGYPDLAFIASNVTSPEPSIVVYKNMLFDKDSRFVLVKSIPIENSKYDYRLSFFDVFEDGDLNVILFGLPNEEQLGNNIFVKANEDESPKDGENCEEKKDKKEYDMSKYDIKYLPFESYKWNVKEFGLFLKASSIGPLSHIHFQDDINFETNIHGPVFVITVSDIYGEKAPRQAIQRPLSGYLPLQLPYVIFGLGNTNNYVEEFYLGMPSASHDYKDMWISIIPNCFVIAVTFPLDIPSKWNLKLSINPSKKFMPILFTNLACLGIIGLFIIVFHAKEKREDSEQEKGFKQKFIAH